MAAVEAAVTAPFPRIWEGDTVFLLGGGPSLAEMDLSPLKTLPKGYRVLGVNQAFELGPWVEAVWFGDYYWFQWNKEALSRYPGLTATCSPRFLVNPHECPGWVRVFRRENRLGLTDRPWTVRWNGNSGASAINFALHLGARKVVLLGFDMKVKEGAPNGGHNWHNKHARFLTPRPSIYQEKFLKCWPAVAEDAPRFGLEIVNATPGSAIEVFPRVELKDVVPSNVPR